VVAEYNPYWFVVVLLGAGVVFCLAPLLLARLWARWVTPGQPGPTKNASYECGLPSQGVEAPRFKSEYYLYGLLFLAFDVEAIFLLPFAVSFRDLAPGGFIAILVFLLLLGEGLAWAWLKGLLTWK
jgi:NADH:ubiquinone oxidoreductase subunit 3 (subunit A)